MMSFSVLSVIIDVYTVNVNHIEGEPHGETNGSIQVA
jgi:hypothetical protein